jgi:thioredoxin 1
MPLSTLSPGRTGIPGGVFRFTGESGALSGSAELEVTMATVTLTGENFEQVVTGNDIVLVDFWASWCGPCRMFAPVYEAASETHTDVVFGKVDTEAQQDLAAQFGIMSIPTLMAFRDQILLYAEPGALPPVALEDVIAQVRALDMDDARRRIAEKESRAAS